MTLIKFYNKGVDAYNHGDWPTAKENFREAIGAQPDKHIEFYLGLMHTCMQSQEWDQVSFACERIAQLFPEHRNEISYDYGMALYRQLRYADAIPWLKRALAVDEPSKPYLPEKVDEKILLGEMNFSTPPPQTQQTAPQPEKPVVVPRVKLDTKDYLTFEEAIKSEEIVLAKYEGYEKGDIHYMDPPIADYHITKILKGSDANPTLHVWYEFHDKVNTAPPKDWKFSEKEMMPKKGSEWILFIEFLASKNGAYETYQGSYGRQPATEENLNTLYGLLDKYNMRKPSNM
ncbi:MAG TPA: tetratricopeptide repeat protein [Planktothrix sp.]